MDTIFPSNSRVLAVMSVRVNRCLSCQTMEVRSSITGSNPVLPRVNAVGLHIALSPPYFSRHYAKQAPFVNVYRLAAIYQSLTRHLRAH